jgi:hypothetical protein
MRTLIAGLIVLSFAASVFAFSKKPASGPVDFETILTGQHSLIDTAAVFLIDNEQDWENIWKLAQGNIEPMPPVMRIDFDKFMILAVFMGRKNTGGYSNEISEISRNGDMLNVKVINHVSGGGMMLPVLTSPFQIVRITKGDFKLNVTYQDVKE